MKRNKKRNSNRKGAVLFTVICFSTVMLMMSSSAISMASYSNTVSTNNLSKTQAQISAENYLSEFMKSVEDTTAGSTNNYSAIIDLASGHTYTNPKVINVSTTNASGDNANVGGCTIYIYPVTSSPDTIVVRSEVSYGKQTDVASAVFTKKTVDFDTTNVVESGDGIGNGSNALVTEGDSLVESTSPTSYTYLHNSQAKSVGNYYCQNNFIAGYNTNTSYISSIADVYGDQYAPTVMADGNIFWTQGQIQNKTKSGTVATKVNGKNGFICTQSKFIYTQGGSIGEDSTDDAKKIDVYCHGAYFGGALNKAYISKIATTVPFIANDYEEWKDAAVGTNSWDHINLGSNTNDVSKLNGNVYCYQNGSDTTSGNFVVTANNTSTINGDLVVQGDIYLYNNSRLKVEKNLYCTGKVYHISWDGALEELTKSGTSYGGYLSVNNASNFYDSLPTTTESIMPSKTYDPSKFSIRNPSASCVRSTTKETYSEKATANNMMYGDPTVASDTGDYLGCRTSYLAATSEANSGYNGNSIIDSGHINTSNIYKNYYYKLTSTQYNNLSAAEKVNVRDYGSDHYLPVYFYAKDVMHATNSNDFLNKSELKHVYIFDNMCINSTALTKIAGGDNKDYQVTVLVSNLDMYMALPEDFEHMNVDVDFSQSPTKTVTKTAEDGTSKTVTNPTNFCYFTVGTVGSNSYYNSAICGDLSSKKWNLFSTTIKGSGVSTMSATSSKSPANNIMILVPDNLEFYIAKENNTECTQACIYAPRSKVTIKGTGGDQRSLYGQIFAKSVYVDNNATAIGACLPSSGSILSYMSKNRVKDCKLQYFVRSKT